MIVNETAAQSPTHHHTEFPESFRTGLLFSVTCFPSKQANYDFAASCHLSSGRKEKSNKMVPKTSRSKETEFR
jgi:hypothetical protein